MKIMKIWIILILVLIIIVLLLVIAKKEQDKKMELMKKAVTSQRYFNETKVIEDKLALFHFAMDEPKQEIYCYSQTNEIRFKYKDIIDTEVQIDGVAVMSSVLSVKGNISDGNVNILIGGMPIGIDKISSIKVRVFLRNCSSDTYDIECLAFRVKSNDARYKETYIKAQSIFDALRSAMSKVGTEDLSYDTKSVVEELKELAILKSQGVVTEEEFAIIKARIMNNVNSI